MMKVVSLIIGVLLCSSSFAYECKATAWPFSNKILPFKYVALFSTMKRQHMWEYFLNEISSPEGDVNLAQKLQHYLRQTEANLDYQNFLELLAYSAELESGKIKMLDLKEICDIQSKIK